MRTDSFSYGIDVQCSADEAMALMSDFHRHRGLNPYLVEVRELPAAPGAVRSFAISDRLRWGPFAFRTTYRADILTRTDRQVITVARQWPRTTLRNHTTVTDTGDGMVHIGAHITFTAPKLLFGYGFRTAQAVHEGLSQRLRNTLERSPGDGDPDR
ncbi:SRPBCC family protein [Luedemannella helvata]|uniref:SRPBCC family protein n=1 Tax=Luedemannella helvata TaxID=349315 RepID=A0ABP4WWM1_9ACTN